LFRGRGAFLSDLGAVFRILKTLFERGKTRFD
jgi:hypothetical protein